MSTAGAQVLTKQEHYLGAQIEVELVTIEDTRMVFQGEVVNLGKEHNSNENKIGIKLDAPRAGSAEASFLESLGLKFKASV